MLRVQKRGIPRFKCPVCKKVVETDIIGMAPCCTGPSESRDDHPLTLMVRLP